MREQQSVSSNATSRGLRFRLLGPFEVFRGDEPVPPRTFRTRQAISLLKILLDERGRTVPAERLVGALWPDSDPDAGRHSLQVAVAAVRAALEPGLRRGTASRYVVTEDRGYRLVDEGVQVDVDALLRAELGVEPTAATHAIREDAREERGAAQQHQGPGAVLRLPFVGRERVARTLDRSASGYRRIDGLANRRTLPSVEVARWGSS